MSKPEVPPEFCPIPKEDKILFENLKREELTTVYAGTIKSDEDFKDVYIIVTRDRIPYIITIRRLCVNKKFLEKAMKREEIIEE